MKNSFKYAGLAAAAATTALLPLASQAAEYATVISATPITSQIGVPRRVCSDERQYVQPQSSGAGAVIGAIAGGLLGNTLGGGGGRAAATGIGAVAGAALGNSVEMNGYPATEVPVQRCQTVSSYENRTVGYDVVYEYAGQRYATRMAQDPGREIRIDVRPAAETLSGRGVPGYPDANAYAPRQALVEAAPPVYYAPGPAYYAPSTVYYGPAPAYYYGAPAYYGPSIGIGIGGSWGGGGRHRHWR